MLSVNPVPEVQPQAARAPVVGSSEACPFCGKPLTGRQRLCSGRCRAALSRQRRAEVLRARDQEVAELLRFALNLLKGRQSKSGGIGDDPK